MQLMSTHGRLLIADQHFKGREKLAFHPQKMANHSRNLPLVGNEKLFINGIVNVLLIALSDGSTRG